MALGNHKRYELSSLLFTVAALITASIIVFLIGFICYMAFPVVSKMGINYFITSEWNYSTHVFGIFPFIIGTIVLTTMTMVISIPVSLMTAIFLAEYAPKPLEKVMRPMIELLVGIPSVVYGIFGLFVLRDIFTGYIDPFISNTFGFIPVFYDGAHNGLNILLASTVLTIMILPTITVLSQETLRSLPREYREASFAMGSTKWEYIKKVALPASLSGITTAILMGVMRAMGETMAIVMLTGNSALIPTSIFDSMYAMTSKIVNDISYYVAFDEGRSALLGIAATLFALEIIIVFISRMITRRSRI